MSVASSSDYGLTWTSPEQIITGTDAPALNKNTGEGDCTAVNGQDGYYYAYCFRAKDGALIVARAPVSATGAGCWRKFNAGGWSQPGLGGDATRLMNGSGASVARWKTTGQLVVTGWVAGGLGIFLTSDHTELAPLREPLLSVDPGQWKRPAPTELIFDPVILDARTGGNQLSDSWLLVYAYIAPNESGSDKYLVFRDVTVSKETSPVSPQVGVLLARWYNTALHDRWSTTAAIPGSGSSYRLENTEGYLMTSASTDRPSSKLEDCVSYRPGHPDHLLATAAFCASHAYQRLRTAGWVYVTSESGTQPVYQCVSDTENSHFAANNQACDGKGRSESLLGYDLIH